jgi:hypothetical protein
VDRPKTRPKPTDSDRSFFRSTARIGTLFGRSSVARPIRSLFGRSSVDRPKTDRIGRSSVAFGRYTSGRSVLFGRFRSVPFLRAVYSFRSLSVGPHFFGRSIVFGPFRSVPISSGGLYFSVAFGRFRSVTTFFISSGGSYIFGRYRSVSVAATGGTCNQHVYCQYYYHSEYTCCFSQQFQIAYAMHVKYEW